MIVRAATPLAILVADDEEGIRTLLGEWLLRAGHRVVTVATGEDAIRAMKCQHFDLLVTDIVMPDGDGFELIGTLKQAQPAVRILAMSGGGKYLQGADCLKMARGLGAHGAVMKPFNWEEFSLAMEKVLRTGVRATVPA